MQNAAAMQPVSVTRHRVQMVSSGDGRGTTDAIAGVSRRGDQGVISDVALDGDSADPLS